MCSQGLSLAAHRQCEWPPVLGLCFHLRTDAGAVFGLRV